MLVLDRLLVCPKWTSDCFETDLGQANRKAENERTGRPRTDEPEGREQVNRIDIRDRNEIRVPRRFGDPNADSDYIEIRYFSNESVSFSRNQNLK